MKIKCTQCGYVMNITALEGAECSGIVVRCKGRHCKKEFEIKVKNGKQIK